VTPVAATSTVATLDTFDSFQIFVKGLEANARREAAARAARAARRPVVLSTPVPVEAPGAVSASSPPDLLPQGPPFRDTPSPLFPFTDSGLGSARSFVLLFGLAAVALGFLAVRARIARRHAFAAPVDDRGDYIDFV
jgi:hypothetical protein